MGAFKKLADTELLTLKQRGGVILFLESQVDYEIIAQRWFFDEGEDLHFQAADTYEQGAGGGGCAAVIDLVRGAREVGVRAFGLVDRDALLHKDYLRHWWEDNDAVFGKARPFGNYVRILLRWEIENYLLDPAAMATVANDLGMKSSHTADEMTAACLDSVDDLMFRSGASVVAAIAEQKGLPEGFGCKPFLKGQRLVDELQRQLERLGIDDSAARLGKAKQEIDRFDAPEASPEKRWERVSRMLDGKAALKYLTHSLGRRFDQHRATLARRLREEKRVPRELKRHVEAFKTMP